MPDQLVGAFGAADIINTAHRTPPYRTPRRLSFGSNGCRLTVGAVGGTRFGASLSVA